MISAEVWISGWKKQMDDLGYEGYILPEFIKAIQANAIRQAVDEIRYGPTYTGRCDDLIPAIKLAEMLE